VKKIVAVFITIVVLISAILSTHETSTNVLTNFSRSNYSQAADLTQNSFYDESSSCADRSHDHQGTHDCSRCHIGHCSFVISKNVLVVDSRTKNIFTLNDLEVVLYNYQFGLFRPPIC